VGRAALTVGDGDTAIALRSGSVPVLATPRVVALCEEASCLAVQEALQDDQTTVGMRVQLDHLAPSGIGAHVTADAVLERIEGRRLVFTVSVSDDQGLIAAGKITRVVVDTERFLKKAH
jgi:fluoroacetyl-CoA thioesterase